MLSITIIRNVRKKAKRKHLENMLRKGNILTQNLLVTFRNALLNLIYKFQDLRTPW